MSLQTRIQLDFKSIEEFIQFVEIIRGKEIDTHELKKITKAISKSDDSLEEAVSSQTAGMGKLFKKEK